MPGDKINSFTQLIVWQESHKLVIAIFEKCEKLDKFDVLKNQIERSVLSITSNIAEGFGRQSTADKRRFYVIARGSMYEVQNQLLVARDTQRINDKDFNALAEHSVLCARLLHGLIRSIKTNGKASSWVLVTSYYS
jgi:four helix bundle protein